MEAALDLSQLPHRTTIDPIDLRNEPTIRAPYLDRRGFLQLGGVGGCGLMLGGLTACEPDLDTLRFGNLRLSRINAERFVVLTNKAGQIAGETLGNYFGNLMVCRLKMQIDVSCDLNQVKVIGGPNEKKPYEIVVHNPIPRAGKNNRTGILEGIKKHFLSNEDEWTEYVRPYLLSYVDGDVSLEVVGQIQQPQQLEQHLAERGAEVAGVVSAGIGSAAFGYVGSLLGEAVGSVVGAGTGFFPGRFLGKVAGGGLGALVGGPLAYSLAYAWTRDQLTGIRVKRPLKRDDQLELRRVARGAMMSELVTQPHHDQQITENIKESLRDFVKQFGIPADTTVNFTHEPLENKTAQRALQVEAMST